MKKNNQERNYVYVVHAETTEKYKIGYTNNVDRRLYELNGKQSPHPIVLKYKVYVINAASVEKFLHSKYVNYKVHNEWFEFQENQIANLIEDMKTFEYMSGNTEHINNTYNCQENQKLALNKFRNFLPVDEIDENILSFTESFLPVEFSFLKWCRNNSLYQKYVYQSPVGYISFLFQKDNKYIGVYIKYLECFSLRTLHIYIRKYILTSENDRHSLKINSFIIVFIVSDKNAAIVAKDNILKIYFYLPTYISFLLGYFDDNLKEFVLYADFTNR